MNSNAIKYRVMMLLLLYMPLHYYICEIFLSYTRFDNLIRDIVLTFLFLIIIKDFRVNKTGIVFLFNCVVLVVFAVFSLIETKNVQIINILRTYLVPSLVYFVASNLIFSKKQIDTIHTTFVVQMAIIAAYGFFQAFFLGDDFLVNIGYPSENGFLIGSSYYIGGFYGFQRSVGTFVSPNVCGLIISFAICVFIYNHKKLKTSIRMLCLGALLIGLLGTFSRSAMFSLLIALIVLYLLLNGLKHIRTKVVFYALIGGGIAIITAIIVDYFLLNGLFVSMLYTSIGGLLTGTDLSAKQHFIELFEPITRVLNNPWGLGFGNNGPMALEYMISANVVESSIYLIMYELGPIFGVIYFLPYIMTISKTIFQKSYHYYVPAAVSMTALITYFFLPNIQTFEVIFYVSFFMGLYNNTSVRKVYTNY